MELLNGVALILSSLWIGGISDLQLCQYGQTTTHHTNINMNSTTLSGGISMCSCRIQLNNEAKITMFPDLNIPGCKTTVSVSDSSFNFSCLNGKISSPYHANKKAWDVLWLFVKLTDESLPMSGNLQVKTNQAAAQFSLECFYPNRNTCATTTIRTPSQTSPEIHTSITKTQDANVSPSIVSISGSTTPNVSTTVDMKRGFPVAAVAGGIAGSLLLILIVVLAVVCFRRRQQEPNLPENGGQRSVIQEYENQLYIGVAGEMKTRKNQTPDVRIENDLYVSADIDIDNQPHAVVDKKYRDQLIVDPNHSESPSPVVNKKQEPQDMDTTHMVSLSGDVYATVDKGKDPLG